MPSSQNKAPRIMEIQQPLHLSATQKKFNGLIRKITFQKKRLASWQEAMPQLQQEAAAKLYPLQKIYSEHQAKMAALLDNHYTTEKFSRNQQDKIKYLILEICEELISMHGRHDMKILYNQYSEDDFDAQVQQDAAMQSDFMKSMFEQAFDVTLDDNEFDFSDPIKIAEQMADKITDQQRQAEEQRNSRKKSAKLQAKEAREQKEQADISKSIQAVYRQLVAALHPDREPDPVERERKTELMQKVTVAYGKRDLLQLLELQLSVEQIDQNNINNIAEDRLKHFNRILQNQLNEITEEIMFAEMGFRNTAGLSPYEPVTPKRLQTLLKQDIRNMREIISKIQHDLRTFQDIKKFKLWLKDYQIPVDDFDPFSMDMSPFDFR
ncbi:MAG: molecular chaperone DnaJ [Gammaproteobacteria bacterium]|nr:molecular chaperone DnaJ [Gammaproteobacteria bacterium]